MEFMELCSKICVHNSAIKTEKRSIRSLEKIKELLPKIDTEAMNNHHDPLAPECLPEVPLASAVVAMKAASSESEHRSSFEILAALALNNMAVTMMEQQCFIQAIATFRDAVYAMKRELQNQKHELEAAEENEDDGDDAIATRRKRRGEQNSRRKQRSRILDKLKQASRRAARPETITSHCVPFQVVSYDNFMVPGILAAEEEGEEDRDLTENDDEENDFSEIAIDGDPAAEEPTLSSSSSPSSSALALIRIGGHDEVDDGFGRSSFADLALIAIVYNLGVSYLCRASLACHTPDGDATTVLQEQQWALRLLYFGRDFLSHQYGECEEEDEERLSRVVFLFSILLKTLVVTLTECGQLDQAKSCLSTLCLLRAGGTNATDAGNSNVEQETKSQIKTSSSASCFRNAAPAA